MSDIADIPEIPDRATRLAEITVDCYGREEELSTFEVYISDALQPPSPRVGAIRMSQGTRKR
jgi:hypothetical protein